MRKSSPIFIRINLANSNHKHGSIHRNKAVVSFLRAKTGRLFVKTEKYKYSAERIKQVNIEGYPKYL